MQINIAARLGEPAQEAARPEPFDKAVRERLADDDQGNVMFLGGSQNSRDQVFIRCGNDLRPEAAGQSQVFFQPGLRGLGQGL